MAWETEHGTMAKRAEEDTRPNGLQVDIDRLHGELGGLEDLLQRLMKRLDPILLMEVPTTSAPELGGLGRDPSSQSPTRAQVQSVISQASRLSGVVNSLIGRVDL